MPISAPTINQSRTSPPEDTLSYPPAELPSANIFGKSVTPISKPPSERKFKATHTCLLKPAHFDFK